MRSVSTILATVTAVGLLSCLPAAPMAMAVMPQTPAPVAGASPDFDGDGLADIVYGLNGEVTEGAVHVVYGSGRTQEITRGVGDDMSSDFGRVILAQDFNGDGYCDLAVTDSPTSLMPTSATIVILLGSAEGLEETADRSYAAPAGARQFGLSLAFLSAPSRLLVVGAEQADVPGGSLAAYPIGSDGLPSGSPFWINQSSAGVPGTAESGDRFGEAVAASGSTLVVGVPGEDIGKIKDAGNVVLLTYAGGQRFSGVAYGQNSAGVPDKAEAYDEFGASVAIGRGVVAVGVPGEEKQGGLVQLFTLSGSKLKPLAAIDQNSSGVPGVGERHDRFGAAVAIAEVCAGKTGVVVGGPGESFLTGEDGAAWVIPVKRTSSCKARLIAENGILGGTLARDGRKLGSVVAVLNHVGTTPDTVLVGVRGSEDVGLGRLYAVAAPYTAGHVTWSDTNIDNLWGFALSR